SFRRAHIGRAFQVLIPGRPVASGAAQPFFTTLPRITVYKRETSKGGPPTRPEAPGKAGRGVRAGTWKVSRLSLARTCKGIPRFPEASAPKSFALRHRKHRKSTA